MTRKNKMCLILIVLVFSVSARAQEIWATSWIDWDDSTGDVYVWAQTGLDYVSAYYYATCTQVHLTAFPDETSIEGDYYDSSQVCVSNGSAEVTYQVTIPTNTRALFHATDHEGDVEYYTYQFDPGCYYTCYDFWDAQGMSLLGVSGPATFSEPTLWYLSQQPQSVPYYAALQAQIQGLGYGQCPSIPTGEYSFYEFTNNPNPGGGGMQGLYGAVFSASLNPPPSGSFSGRTTYETILNFTDACYANFPQSQYGPAQVIGGSSWPVDSQNNYGLDIISADKARADYYQGIINGPAPPYGSCGTSATQRMSISCGNSQRIYDLGHAASFTITSSSMTSVRGNASGPAK